VPNSRSAGRATQRGGRGTQSQRKRGTASGRYTPPIPRQQRRSPGWFPYVIVGLLVLGLLVIILNYANVFPGGTNDWYLVGGIVAILGGLIFATNYH